MIGIFDSGVGGLTVLRAVRRRLPSVDIVYVGDTKYAPYGGRTREEITLRTIEAIRVLARHKATSILSACNSVSASLAMSLFDVAALPYDRLIEMVGPAVSAFRGSTERLLVAATPATITSGIYQNAFHMIGKEVMVVPIPDLAGAIEQGVSALEQERIIQDAFASIEPTSFDTLILACTHYPLVTQLFERVIPGVHIFDPADAVAERVEQTWWPREVGDGKLSFLLTKESDSFRSIAKEMFPHATYSVEVIE